MAIYLVHESLKSAVSWDWVYELSWFFACWLWYNNFLSDQDGTLYLWLLNVSLVSVLLSCYLSGCVLEIGSLDFFEFWHGARNSEVVCDRVGVFGKYLFCSKIWEMAQEQGFFNLKKSFVIDFHWICSIMEIYIIYFVPAEVLYWEKFCSWDICQSALSHSDCRIFKSTISSEQIDEIALFFACFILVLFLHFYKFTKIKSWPNFFWLGMVKNGCEQFGFWTQKLIVSQELQVHAN